MLLKSQTFNENLYLISVTRFSPQALRKLSIKTSDVCGRRGIECSKLLASRKFSGVETWRKNYAYYQFMKVFLLAVPEFFIVMFSLAWNDKVRVILCSA